VGGVEGLDENFVEPNVVLRDVFESIEPMVLDGGVVAGLGGAIREYLLNELGDVAADGVYSVNESDL
jgi:hypothetical protein